MKRFLVVSVVVGIFLLAGFYGVTRYGLYVSVPGEQLHIEVQTRGKHFYVRDCARGWRELIIQGVDLTASMPGHTAHEYAATCEDYLRWMQEIKDMGANAIRVYQIMDGDFYQALYEFNAGKKDPLYLLQGIQVYDAINYGAGDAYREEFIGNLLKDGRTVVDIIHGKRVIVTNQYGGTGNYFKDISPYVIGFLVGNDWSSDVIAYTNMQKTDAGKYQGEYFTTDKEATAFEAMLAQVMDAIMKYESDKYATQRPIGFINDPQNDPFEYADSYHRGFEKYEKPQQVVTYARQLNKYNQLDAQRIQKGEKNQAGYFAAYHLYDFCENFSEYLSEEQKKTLGSLLQNIHKDRSYEGYLDLLGSYHTMPVMAAGFGISTARGMISDRNREPVTEERQGEELLTIYQDIRAAGMVGGFITSWQDEWERKSWNTAYAQDYDNNYLWKDVQTESQGYGILEFNSNQYEVDGKISEWEPKDKVIEAEGMQLSAYMDGEGLCLMIQGEEVGKKIQEGTPIYIPMDVTLESGSRYWFHNGKTLVFDRAADFILCIQGQENTRLLVHSRYESVRENFLKEIAGENPFLDYPDKWEEKFVPVTMVMKNNTMVAELNHKNMYLKYLPVWETGKLTYANNNPAGENYNSLGDFYFSQALELRIPWGMLNFANPPQRLVHKDYYENYGVDFQEIKTIALGIGLGDKNISMKEFALKWKAEPYQERLKQSYYIIKASWR